MAEDIQITRAQIRRRMRLPWSVVIKIAMASFQNRRMRTFITILSLSLAIAFLSYTIVCSDMARSLRETADRNVVLKLERLGYELDTGQDDQLRGPSKKIWIVALSLLVCVVGIINTQLMLVMEQYREIGTMKCLGALDSVIFRILTMEALIRGLLGATGGAVVGVILAFVSFSAHFGFLLYQHLDVVSLILRFAASIIVGCALSFIGIAYPAVIVARMQPTEALRVDR